MSNQGQHIDPSKMIGGRRAMTQSHQKERQRGEEVKGGQMVQGLLRLHTLNSHRWLTRTRRWST